MHTFWFLAFAIVLATVVGLALTGSKPIDGHGPAPAVVTASDR